MPAGKQNDVDQLNRAIQEVALSMHLFITLQIHVIGDNNVEQAEEATGNHRKFRSMIVFPK
jgi:hypothetical protein